MSLGVGEEVKSKKMSFESYIGAQNMGIPSTFHEIEVCTESSAWNPPVHGVCRRNGRKNAIFHFFFTSSTSNPMYRGVPVG